MTEIAGASSELAAPAVEGGRAARHFTRNAGVFVAFDAFWSLGSPCCLMSTVMPAYLLFLGSSKTLMQVVVSAMSFMVVLQIISGTLFGGPRRRVAQVLIWSVFPACWIAYGLLAYFGWGKLPQALWMPVFVVMVFALGSVNSLAAPAYVEIVLDNTPLGRRGRLAAMRNFGIGTFGLVGLWLASSLMSRYSTPLNFHTSFIVGGMLMLVSCLSVLLLRDCGSVHPHTDSFRSAWRDARKLMGNFNFRVFLVFYALLRGIA